MAGIHSAMSAVDKATPEQLKMMLDDPANPYRALALMKLQEFRNAKMQAAQPPAPPLSQTISQQVEGGIPQAMPQAAPQTMPQMAGGGIIAFKGGGDIQHYAEGRQVSREPLPPLFLYDMSGGPVIQYPQATPNVQADSGTAQYFATPEEAVGAPGGFSFAETREAGKKYEPSLRGAIFGTNVVEPRPSNFRLNAPSASSGITDSINKTGNEPEFAAKSIVPGAPPAPAAKDEVRRPAPGGIGGLPASTSKFFGDAQTGIDKAYADLAKGHEDVYEEMKKGIERSKGDVAKFKAAQMTDEEAATLRSSKMKELDAILPDQNKRIAAEIEKIRAENAKSESDAPYQGLLKMATSLMATNKTNFLQAVGEAGGAGLEEFNKLKTANSAKKAALLSADASLAAAQEARQRGIYSEANRLVDQAAQKKMDAAKFERDSDVLTTQMAIQAAAYKADIPKLEVEKLKTKFAVQSTLMEFQMKQQDLAMRGDAQAMSKIPPAIRDIAWLEKHPEWKTKFELQSAKITFLSEADKIRTLAYKEKAKLIENGVPENDPRMDQYSEKSILDRAARVASEATNRYSPGASKKVGD
jgi:hypothetical protein